MRQAQLLLTLLTIPLLMMATGCGDEPHPVRPQQALPAGDWVLENTGRMLDDQGAIVDVGLYSVPDLADIDGDNDLDMFIGEWWGKIWFYRNDGNRHRPVWHRADTMYMGIDVGRCAAPSFVDIDDDGDLDLFVGTAYSVGYTEGNLCFYRNVGTPSQASFQLVTSHYLGVTNTGIGKPEFFDLDNDGDLDMFIGYEESFPDGFAGLLAYRNDGTAHEAHFSQITDKFLSWGGTGDSHQYVSYLSFGDINGDQAADLILGSWRQLYLYMRRPGGTFEAPVELTYAYHGMRSWRAPDFADVNHDGLLDVVVGVGVGFALDPDDVQGVIYLLEGKLE